MLAIIAYLGQQDLKTSLLFKFKDSCLLNRDRFMHVIRSGLKEAGIDDSKYCSHSFRIGAATTAAAAGIEDSVIMTISRWESLAYMYLQYIKIPRD